MHPGAWFILGLFALCAPNREPMRIETLILASVCAIAAGCVHPNEIGTGGLPDREGAIAVTASTIDILFPKIDGDTLELPRGDEQRCASRRLSWQVVFDVPPTAQAIPFRHFAFSVYPALLKRPQHKVSDALTNGFLRACVAESHFLICATSVDGSVRLYHDRLRIRLARRGVVAQLLGAAPARADVHFLYNCDPWIGGSVLIRYPRVGA